MCLILLAIHCHPIYDLILLANRDEFYKRDSKPAHFWDESPQLLAGKDLRGGGTWLGVTKYGKIAAITNYRDPAHHKPSAPSRGGLVRDFLQGQASSKQYLENVIPNSLDYNGFNLLLGERDRIFWYTNHTKQKKLLSLGIHGVSNHLLDTPWPKVTRGIFFLEEIISDKKEIVPEMVFQFLRDDRVPEDKDLPDTGVGLERERVLSPIFITSPDYGTRSSTILVIDKDDQVTFIERTYDSDVCHPSTVRFDFRIKKTE
ncbi:MAG: NRDE family protein [Deltaproteobacteria bacterium]|nr:NRDE family protein [Deltaproteobacteria bacterium]